MRYAQRVVLVLLSVIAALALPGKARAQCQSGWLDAPDIPSTSGFGTNGVVRAVCSWDPDGAGAAPPVLVIGGVFTTVGGTVGANNIAVWSNGSWQTMGSGVTGGSAGIWALAVFNNELYAAGTFTSAGGVAANNIAKWNGTSWSALGAGVTGATVSVRAMAEYGGFLYVSGTFSTAGGVARTGMARWNGAWSFAPAGGDPSAWALAVYQGELYAGGQGQFNQAVVVHRFNGASWSTTPSGLVGTIDANDNFPSIRALLVHDNKLVVGGNFENAGPFNEVNGVVMWDGTANTWVPMGFGADEPVYALAAVNGTLYAGGAFNTMSPSGAMRVARWNGGSVWSAVSTSATGSGTIPVLALCGHQGDLIVGGQFTSLSGRTLNNVGVYDPASQDWTQLHTPTPIRVFSGALTAGGDFQVDVGGGVIARRIVGWNGSSLGAISDLGGFTGPNGPVYSVGAYNPSPFAIGYNVYGGAFTVSGGIAVNNLTTFRLSTWGTLGSGFNGTVRSMANIGSSLYAAGDFTASGVTACLRVARYVSGAWQQVGAGFNGPVHVLFVHNNQLYAGGTFTASGATPINYLAVWNGTAWTSVGDGLFSNGAGSGVFCMTSYSGDAQGPYLVVGGKFLTNFNSVRNLARLGSITFAFGGYGSHVNDTVRAAAMYEGDLVVGGDFTQTPGGPMSRIARYDLDGGGWQAMGQGVDGPVFALRSYGLTELHVGGAFASAGGLNSPHWGRWNTTGRPAVTTLPSGRTASCQTTFTVGALASYGPLTYQWQRNGVPLANGVSPTGSVISGANGATMTISNLQPEDSGSYTCVVSNTCGGTVTPGATLTATRCCDSTDFDGDGDAGTDADIEAFFACIGGSCCATCGDADFDNDGDAGTDADIESFFRVLGGGAC